MKYEVAAAALAFAGTTFWGTRVVRAFERDLSNPVDATIQAHVYVPTRLPATDALVRQLRLPDGFRIQKFADNLENPRMLAVADDGSVYVTRRQKGDCVLLRDTNGDGKADVRKVVARKPMLHGVVLRGNKVYLATVKEVYVADRKANGNLGALRQVLGGLPDGGQHPNRTLAFGPDGMLYVSVGSTCNACPETSPESATIVRANPDGSGRAVYASGLRNTIGFGWHPVSKQMFGMDHGIDWLGDDEQKEELNQIVAGGRYGWPYVYADGKFNPADDPKKDKGITRTDWAKMSREPELLYTAHSAPLQMAFYTGGQFPGEYKNDAFVAMRGSWNRKTPSGYEVVRVKFDAHGRPLAIEPFLSGFLIKQPDGNYAHFARLAGLAVARDGALLVGDDTNGVIYRVAYTGKKS